MVVVCRAKKEIFEPCWLMSSELFPESSVTNLPIAATSQWQTPAGTFVNINSAFDRVPTALQIFNGTIAQLWNLKLTSGSDLFGCDQVVFTGDMVNRQPVQIGYIAGTQPEVAFNATQAMLNPTSSAEAWSVSHDRDYPTTEIKVSVRAGTTGTMSISECLPVGGKRTYRRIYRSADKKLYSWDIYGKNQFTLKQSQIAVDSFVLPRVAHTMTQVSPGVWEAVPTLTAGARKTSYFAYTPHTAQIIGAPAAVRSLITSVGTNAWGNYWMQVPGDARPFLSLCTHDNYISMASSFSDGRAAAMTSEYICIQGSNTTLPLTVLSGLNITKLSLATKYDAPGIPYTSAASTVDTTMISRAKSLTALSQGVPGDNVWVKGNGNIVMNMALTSVPPAPVAESLNNRVWWSMGNSGGLHWIPNNTGASLAGTGDRRQLNLFMQIT
jgi:hypothetical protein